MHRTPLLLSLALVAPAAAQPPAGNERIVHSAVKNRLYELPLGTLVIGGGGANDEMFAAFVRAGGGAQGKLVVIPTAAETVDDATRARAIEAWKQRGFGEVAVLHTRDRKLADTAEFTAPLRTATAVWLSGGQQSRICDAYLGTRAHREIEAVLTRGGAVGGASAGAACQSGVMIAGGRETPELAKGLDFLRGFVIDQHFSERKREARLQEAIRRHPELAGVGIDERTAIVVRGRRIQVVGEGKVAICLAADKAGYRPARLYRIGPRERADLIMLRRAAYARSHAPFPRDAAKTPNVANGMLVLVGGGGVPRGLWRRMVEAAGGPDARWVVIPTAAGDRASTTRNSAATALHEAGAKHVDILHVGDHGQLTAEFLDTLREARGVWFGGGRQWRLVDSYEDTPAYGLFHAVLAKGGVIGGSSAGTSIQAELMVRGSPLGNTDMMAEGYERGFGFLPGAAVDQHFTQRNRFADMSGVMKTYPKLLGFGVDERTAMVVRGHVVEVVGNGSIAVYDFSNGKPVGEDGKDYVSVASGSRYDMRARKRLD